MNVIKGFVQFIFFGFIIVFVIVLAANWSEIEKEVEKDQVQRVERFERDIDTKIVDDAITEYRIAKKSHDKISICVHPGSFFRGVTLSRAGI